MLSKNDDQERLEDSLPESLRLTGQPIACLFVSPPVWAAAKLQSYPSLSVSVPRKVMWVYLAVLVGLYYLLRWQRERQVVSHLRDKYVLITGCDSGFGNLLARQLDLRGLRVLAACLTEQGAQQLRKQTSDRLETVLLDVTKTESVAAAKEWVKERVGDRGTTQLSHVRVLCLCEGEGPCQLPGEESQRVFQALGSSLCSCPHAAAQPSLCPPGAPLPTVGLCSLGRVFPAGAVSLQTSCLVSPPV